MALLTMSQKEVDRYSILKKVLARELNGTDAAGLLELSARHIRRLKKNVREQGAKGLIHGLRGKPSNRRMNTMERERAIQLLKSSYADFKPTFACEKLRELHRITCHPTTVRNIMISEGLWKPRKSNAAGMHRAWRARKDHPGELAQFDGSYEFWFEERGPRACLLAAVDDATGKILHAEFADHEGVFPVFGFWKRYVEAHGKPRAVYLDKFSTYKQNRPAGEEDGELKTQFQRACQELDIEPIFANSPQAKGRVERLFQTLQDRLIKELRLQNISIPEHANRFLKEVFISDFNRRFSVSPASLVDLHRRLSLEERKRLDAILSRQEERIIRNDYTVSFKNAWYQILPTPRLVVRPKDRVLVEERLNGSLHMRIRQSYLRFEKLPDRPQKAREHTWVLAELPEQQKIRIPYKPPADHPWRAAFAAKRLVPAKNDLVQCALSDDTRSA